MQEPQETRVWSLGQENPLEEDMTTYSSILAWRIPWTEESGGLQSMASQRVRHDWSDLACTHREKDLSSWDPIMEGAEVFFLVLLFLPAFQLQLWQSHFSFVLVHISAGAFLGSGRLGPRQGRSKGWGAERRQVSREFWGLLLLLLLSHFSRVRLCATPETAAH